MGKIHTHKIRQIAQDIYDIHKNGVSEDFQLNKDLLNRVMIGGNKQLRNKVAGLLVNLKKNENRIIESPHKTIRKMDRM